MRLRPLILLTAMLVISLIAAGCGDDGEEPTTVTTGATGATGAAGPAPTKEAFIADADRICQAAEVCGQG